MTFLIVAMRYHFILQDNCIIQLPIVHMMLIYEHGSVTENFDRNDNFVNKYYEKVNEES